MNVSKKIGGLKVQFISWRFVHPFEVEIHIIPQRKKIVKKLIAPIGIKMRIGKYIVV